MHSMSKKPSRAKNIRRKVESDDEEEQTENTVVTSAVKKMSLDKKKKKDGRKAAVLSFEDEEEDSNATFQVKKSNASLRLASDRKLRLPENLSAEAKELDEGPRIESQTVYTNEMIESLRAGTPSLPPALKTAKSGDDALIAEKFPSLMNTSNGLPSIPDANMIHAMKKKRELLRKGGIPAGEDYISLDDPNQNSRLVREEDDFADDGEEELEKYFGEKTSLNKNEVKKQEKERREGVRELINEAQDEDEQEDDEDMERWEQNLIRHGGVRRSQETEQSMFTAPSNYRLAIPPDPSVIPSIKEILGRLDMQEIDLVDKIRQVDSLATESVNASKREEQGRTDVEKEIEQGAKRYAYFQELTTFINDLGEFLDEKFPSLEELEKEAYALIAARHDEIISRRWRDDVDDLGQFRIIPEEAIHTINEALSQDGLGMVEESLSPERARQKRSEERQKRLQRRPDLSARTGDDAIQHEGLWSDDEMPEAWISERDAQLKDIQENKLPALFTDVDDKFVSLRSVKDQFEPWKREFLDDYEKAFGALSLPGAFEFYVRCELICWDPFSTPIDFHEMQWHKVLSEYGVSDGSHDDTDLVLLSRVVEKIIVKKIISMASTLNVASAQSMQNAAEVVEQVTFYIDKKDTPKHQELTATLEEAVEKTLLRYAKLMDVALPKAVTVASGIEAKKRFVWRQVKYINNLYIWRRDFPRENLLSIGKTVINRVLAPILLQSGNDPSEVALYNAALAALARLEQ